MNTTFNYHVILTAPQQSGEIELRTNDIHLALETYLDEMQNGTPVTVVSGLTGEVLAIANNEGIEDHTNAEFELMVRGYLATLTAEEEELVAEEEVSPPDYPDNSMILTVDSGEEVVIPLSEEQMKILLFGEVVNTAFII